MDDGRPIGGKNTHTIGQKSKQNGRMEDYEKYTMEMSLEVVSFC